MQIMLLLAYPDDFSGWIQQQKVQRYRRLLAWHEFISKLSPKVVTQAWASHQVLNHREPSASGGVYVVVLDVESLSQYDEIMTRDPLRDVTKYLTVLLTNLENDWVDDQKRFDDAKEHLFGKTLKEPAEYTAMRRLFKSTPDYVGKHAFTKPLNPVVPYKGTTPQLQAYADKPIEVLIYGMNPTEKMTWDDARKLIHYEKVIWWHHHIAQMLEERRVSHVWGTHDFCSDSSSSGNSAGAATVYRARDLDEFDSIYRLDPLRQHGRFISVLLKPVDEQRALDEQKLVQAEQLLT